ncbi:MAG: hypothetical protein ABJF11_19420 [Reichenbachiella sp.]|uniref:hypothetical protein n=1 Tax=Reichenbachiella sp. TaxID=2184521 RepID=UPI00326621A1
MSGSNRTKSLDIETEAVTEDKKEDRSNISPIGTTKRGNASMKINSGLDETQDRSEHVYTYPDSGFTDTKSNDLTESSPVFDSSST